MQTDLHLKYGHCEIPKGVLLYRGHSTHNIIDAIFFTPKYFSAHGWGDGVQVWKTKKKIKVLFLIRHIDAHARAVSSITDLYYDIYPNTSNKKLNDLDVKQDVRRRDPFTKNLFLNYGINGWLTSIEDNDLLEICLFNKKNIEDSIECIDVVKNGDNYEKDSLRKIKIYPNVQFYKKSRSLIIKNVNYNARGKDQYKNYRADIRNNIKEYIESGGTELGGKNYYYDLRIKLKI